MRWRKGRAATGKKQVFTLAPSGIMPYCVGYTDDVPFRALSYVFGCDDDYWYRLKNQLGRYDLVPIAVKDPENLPDHLLTGKKITWLNDEEVVVTTTVGDDCVLSASVMQGT